MKQMTCRQIDGLCDASISGSNPEEVLDNRLSHLKEAGALSYEHQKVFDDMRFMSENEKAKWRAKFLEKWEKTS
jgi:hypothetical protein